MPRETQDLIRDFRQNLTLLETLRNEVVSGTAGPEMLTTQVQALEQLEATILVNINNEGSRQQAVYNRDFIPLRQQFARARVTRGGSVSGSRSSQSRGSASSSQGGFAEAAAAAGDTRGARRAVGSPEDLRKQMHDLLALMRTMEKVTNEIGTPADGYKVRKSATSVEQEASLLQKDIVKGIAALERSSGSSGYGGPDQALRKKLPRDWQRLSQEYQRVKSALNQKQVRFPASNVTAGAGDLGLGGGSRVGDDPEMEAQTLAQMQAVEADLDFNAELINERGEAITVIAQQTQQIHGMFQDLARLVDHQQEDIEAIDEATNAAHKSAQQGLEQLHKAADNQTTCVVM